MLELEHRRSNFEIIAEILRLGEASKTEIMYAVNLSYAQLERYLNHLIRLRLLDKVYIDGQSLRYRVTTKGLGLLREIDAALVLLDVTKSRV